MALPSKKIFHLHDDKKRERFGMASYAVMSRSDLSMQARALYALLTTYANERGECWPSRAELVAACGVTERSVRSWLSELRKARVIEVIRRTGETPLYRLTSGPEIPEADFRSGKILPDDSGSRFPERKNFSGISEKFFRPHNKEEHTIEHIRGESAPARELLPDDPNLRYNPAYALPTQTEIRQYAERVGIPTPVADDFFDHYTGQGWKTGGGAPITHWPSKLNRWWRDQQARDRKERMTQQKPTGGGPHIPSAPIHGGR